MASALVLRHFTVQRNSTYSLSNKILLMEKKLKNIDLLRWTRHHRLDKTNVSSNKTIQRANEQHGLSQPDLDKPLPNIDRKR